MRLFFRWILGGVVGRPQRLSVYVFASSVLPALACAEPPAESTGFRAAEAPTAAPLSVASPIHGPPIALDEGLRGPDAPGLELSFVEWTERKTSRLELAEPEVRVRTTCRVAGASGVRLKVALTDGRGRRRVRSASIPCTAAAQDVAVELTDAVSSQARFAASVEVYAEATSSAGEVTRSQVGPLHFHRAAGGTIAAYDRAELVAKVAGGALDAASAPANADRHLEEVRLAPGDVSEARLATKAELARLRMDRTVGLEDAP